MSCFIVSKQHIDQIVAGAVRLGIIDRGDTTRVGRMLTNANRRSVRDRYGDWDDDVVRSRKRGPYWYAPPREPLSDVALLKQVYCYSYQTSEIWNYEKTTAYRFVRKMERALEALGLSRDAPGYNEAPWGV